MSRFRELAFLGLLVASVTATAEPLRLRAVDASGAPIAGARLELRANPPLETVPAQDGWLDADLPAGAIACVVAPGFVPQVAAPGDSTLTLAAAGSASGVVVDTATGAPLAGLRVAPEPTSRCSPHALTDAKGAWRLDGLAPGARALVVDGGPAHLDSPPLRARVLAGEAARLDARLHPSFTLTLALTDAAGAPVAGAEARVLAGWKRRAFVPELADNQREAIDAARPVSDVKGLVVLPPLPRDAAWRVAVKDARFAPRSVTVDGRRASATEVVTLRTGGSLALTLVDELETPVAGATGRWVSATHADLDLLDAPAESGKDGVLRATHLPPGVYAIEVRAPGFRPRVVRGLVVAEGKALAAPPVVLDPGAALAALVVDDAGPVSGAHAELRTWSDGGRLDLEEDTDAAGRVRFEGLDPEARCTLVVHADGYVEQELERLAPGQDELRMVLLRAGRVEVTVTDAETGEPVTGATVTLKIAGEHEHSDCEAQDVPGRYDCDEELAGPRLVTVRAAGYLPVRGETLDVVAGDEPLRHAFALTRGGRITGRVVDGETKAPVAFASVRAGEGWDVASDRDGRFTLDGVDETTEVVVTHALYVPSKLPEVKAGSEIEVALETGGSAEGVVHAADGAAQAGAQVRADGNEQRTTSGPDGRYRLDGLAPGRTRLVKTDDGVAANLEEQVVEIVKGQVAHADFGVSRRLIGVVTLRGEPAPGARLTAMPAVQASNWGPDRPWSQAAATADASGRYALGGVEPGTWSVHVTFRGRHFGLDVTIPEGTGAFERDIEIPDLHLAGRVVDPDGAPIREAWVLATPTVADGRALMFLVHAAGERSGDMLTFSTFPQSEDVTGPDGRFRLDLAAGGEVTVSAGLDDSRDSEPMKLDVTASRDDLVIELPSSDTGRIVVKIRDAVSGLPIEGSVMRVQGGSTSISGGVSDWTFEQALGETSTVLATGAGFAAALVENVEADPDGPKELELRLGRGGDLRLTTAPGALALDHGFGPALHVVLPSGLDLASNLNLGREVLARHAEQVGPGEWLLRHLPEGELRLGIGSATPRPVQILEGQEASLDLR